ncbi:MAG: amidophosphoribosyltransferase [Oscillatoriales cyanobacterium SM2_2_1]|nr:amidophosphoribosyltransferase [Oscillatoriales cyanobacterium SM2_2_1]
MLDHWEEERMLDHPQESCGVFGVIAPSGDVAKLVYFGLYALQHRGQESAGISSYEGAQRTAHVYKAMGLVSQVFHEITLEELPGNLAIGHTRYSTTGSSRVVNAQPVVVSTRLGDFSLAHNGNLVNALELRAELAAQGYTFSSTTDSEGIAYGVAAAIATGMDWTEGIITALRRCHGAFSLVMAVPGALIGARDLYGVRPLVLGRMSDGTYILSSETCGLDILSAEFIRDILPGEMVWIDHEGVRSHLWEPQPQPKLCIFELIYFARPDSVMRGDSLYSYRMRLGKILAQEAPVAADIVIGVPDSGIPAAIGYSQASGIPYAEGLIKNRYVGRTFIQPTQAMRESGIRMKLNPLRDVLQGRRVIVIDDSIVRGTTSRKIVRALRNAGATEVHMRISSPPVTHPCFYGIDTDSQDHLIASRLSVSDIARQIEVDSLSYLSEAGMLAATDQDPSQFCTACFTGKYPITIPEQLKRTKLLLETAAP